MKALIQFVINRFEIDALEYTLDYYKDFMEQIDRERIERIRQE